MIWSGWNGMNNSGASSAEYALIVGVLSTFVVIGMTAFGASLAEMFGSLGEFVLDPET